MYKKCYVCGTSVLALPCLALVVVSFLEMGYYQYINNIVILANSMSFEWKWFVECRTYSSLSISVHSTMLLFISNFYSPFIKLLHCIIWKSDVFKCSMNIRLICKFHQLGNWKSLCNNYRYWDLVQQQSLSSCEQLNHLVELSFRYSDLFLLQDLRYT